MGVLPGMTGVSQIISKYKLTDQERLESEVSYVEFRVKSGQITSLYVNFLILSKVTDISSFLLDVILFV